MPQIEFKIVHLFVEAQQSFKLHYPQNQSGLISYKITEIFNCWFVKILQIYSVVIIYYHFQDQQAETGLKLLDILKLMHK